MRLETILSESALRFGNRPVVVAAGRQHTYADLARSSDRVAAALMGRGIRRGDCVALFLDDSFEAVVSAFAVLKAGATATPIAATDDVSLLVEALVGTGSIAIVTDARRASMAAKAIARAHEVRLVLLVGGDRSTAADNCLIYEDVVGGIGFGPEIERAGPASDPAVILHSDDAGVFAVSHAEFVSAAEAVRHAAQSLSAVLTHHGLCQLVAIIRAGATLVLEAPSALRHGIAGDEDGPAGVPALAV